MKNKDVIQLSDHFTLPRLMRFCLPSIVMMVLRLYTESLMDISCQTLWARPRSLR